MSNSTQTLGAEERDHIHLPGACRCAICKSKRPSPEEYSASITMRARMLINRFVHPDWQRARAAIRSIPHGFANAHICRDSRYACGLWDFIVDPGGQFIMSRFCIGICASRGTKVEKVYFAQMPLIGMILVGTVLTDEELIEMMTDSIELVIKLTLEGEKPRIDSMTMGDLCP